LSKHAVPGILGGYAAVVFVEHPAAGALFCAATFLHPAVGVAGLLAAIIGWGTARWSGLPSHLHRICACNALLVGLSLGAVYPLSAALAALVVTAAAMAAWLTAVLADMLWRIGRLPPLSLAFVLVAFAANFAAQANLHAMGLAAGGADLVGAPWDGFLTALGSAFFSPYPAVGLAVLAGILLSSRYLALLAVTGYIFGHLLFVFWAGDGAELMGRWGGFNFILTAMAIGGVFAVPSVASFLAAMVGVAVATLFATAGYRLFLDFNLPSLALPFVLSTLLALAALRMRVTGGGPSLVLERPDLPEKLLERMRLARARGVDGRALPVALPFFGEWQVSQGFDGAHTHQQAWRHALDFEVRVGGRAFRDAGQDVADYYCFGLPVLSPVVGRVAACRDDLADNAPGETDLRHNWGNYLLLHLFGTRYVLLAHLRQHSLKVRVDEYVKVGQAVAACGSSGRSPEPHLHLHVQDGEALGSPTLPFCLSCVIVSAGAERKFHLTSVPRTGDGVETPANEGKLARALHLPAGKTLSYRVRCGDSVWQNRELACGVSLLGQRYLSSDRGAAATYEENDSLQAFYDRIGGRDEFFDIWLLALGVTPVGETVHVWEDAPPARLLPLSLLERVAVSVFHPVGASLKSTYQRNWDQKAGRWRQSGQHAIGLAGREISLRTEAEIDPVGGCAVLTARIGKRNWRAELLASGLDP
jgi:urea transporter